MYIFIIVSTNAIFDRVCILGLIIFDFIKLSTLLRKVLILNNLRFYIIERDPDQYAYNFTMYFNPKINSHIYYNIYNNLN